MPLESQLALAIEHVLPRRSLAAEHLVMQLSIERIADPQQLVSQRHSPSKLRRHREVIGPQRIARPPRVRVIDDVADAQVFKQDIDVVGPVVNPAFQLRFYGYGRNPRASELLEDVAVANYPDMVQNQALESR